MSTLEFKNLAVGDTFDLGTYPMDREAIIAFASRYDPQPYHLDEDATAGHPIFKRMSASGWHSVMVTQLMLSEFWKGTRVQGLAGGGVEAIRWLEPVYPGDVLTGSVTLSMVRRSKSRPERGLMTMDVTLCNQDGAQVLFLSITGVFLA